MKIKNVIFLGRKANCLKALKYLLEQNIKVKLIVGVKEDKYFKRLSIFAKKNDIKFIDSNEPLYQLIETNHPSTRNIDLVISYLYNQKIKNSLIKLPKIGCINLHPAPLPDYKGRAGYNTAILEGKNQYGVSAHFIDSETFDSGPIIKVLKFPVNNNENALSLYEKSQSMLLKLFKQVISLLQSKDQINTVENSGGLYLKGSELEELKTIDLNKDSLETIHKKIRAFFFPPYTGAKINIQGEEFTLVSNDLLKYLAKLIS